MNIFFKKHKLTAIIISIVLSLLYVIRTKFPFVAPSSEIDPSWIYGLSYASVNKYLWGKDIIFTYGPLFFLDGYYNILSFSSFRDISYIIIFFLLSFTYFFYIIYFSFKYSDNLNIFTKILIRI